MKKEIKSQYKMATTAIHKLGDISRDDADLCVVSAEDDHNYYGNWVCGFGFAEVQFPKATTRDLTPEEIEEHHGQPLEINGDFSGVVNITGEKLHKHVVVTHMDSGKVRSGMMISPLKVGRVLYILKDDGDTWHTSTVQSIEGNTIKTRNSTYTVEYT